MDVIIAAGAGEWESAALNFIHENEQLRLLRRCVDTIDLLAVAPDISSSVALLDPDLVGLDADIISRLKALDNSVYLVYSADSDAQKVHDMALRLGADGGIDDTGWGQLLTSPPRRRHVGERQEAEGKVIAVWGPAGAPGRTTVSIGIAAQFACAQQHVLLVDGDPYGGSIAQNLGVMDEVSGLLSAIRAANNGSGSVIDAAAYRVSDFDVLTGLPHARMWTHARSSGFGKVVSEAKRAWSTSVIDTGFSIENDEAADPIAPQRNQLTCQSLLSADHIVVCGSADPVGLTRLIRGLHDLKELTDTKPIVVINRFRKRLGWPRREIVETVERLSGFKPDVFVPFDLDLLDTAVIEGKTVREVSPQAELTSSFAAISALCTQN